MISGDLVAKVNTCLRSKKTKPVSAPQEQTWGKGEFLVRDPDGYNLVISKRE